MPFSTFPVSICLGVLFLSSPLILSGQDTLLIAPAQGLPIFLDGNLQIDEWQGATQLPMTGQGEVLLMGRGEYLSVGVRGPGPDPRSSGSPGPRGLLRRKWVGGHHGTDGPRK